MSLYIKFKMEYSWARNMFTMSKYGLLSGSSNIRRSQRVCIESSWSRTNLPEISSVGQKWAHVWLQQHLSEAISLYRKFKIDYSWVRNMFSSSNMDYCLADLRSDGVYIERSRLRTLGPEISSVGQKWAHVWLT